MSGSKPCTIPYTSLKNGKYLYEFQLDNVFFEAYEYSIVKKGELLVNVTLEKNNALNVVHCEIKGLVQLECDRCLSEYPQKVKVSEKAYIKIGTEEEEIEDEVIFMDKNETELDLSNYIYELITVSLPMISIPNDCNTTKKYCDEAILEKISNIKESIEKIDDANPFSALKKLNNNQN